MRKLILGEFRNLLKIRSELCTQTGVWSCQREGIRPSGTSAHARAESRETQRFRWQGFAFEIQVKVLVCEVTLEGSLVDDTDSSPSFLTLSGRLCHGVPSRHYP